ncbi:PREDICTED: sodium channel protein Nach-like, partial [Nicrophorus vespilloides]|uniref:Sodium channel protein Nach-like n=1 Tax=Nicrophorus vespilloides TaxID=110193 RepID=A0ABM1N0Z1_NICVS
VALHYNDDYPVNAKYRVISSSYITYFQITGTSIEDSEEVQMLPVDQRECVYEHEVKLKYFNGYSDNNCLTECEINEYIAQCEPLCGLEHLKENMTLSEITMINIYFSNDVFTILQRDIVTGSIYLMSSLGGTFSLFLGCSFTSAFEILYYLSIRFLINLKVFKKIENTGRQTKTRRIVCIPLDKTKKHIYYDNHIFYN